MPSPFPGMAPYLEGYLWPDVHHRLATQISLQLGPKIQPTYVARLEMSMIEDNSFEMEIGVMYPDVEVIQVRPTATPPTEASGGVAVADPIFTASP